jgi:enoyl-CoA hydratase/carnithine racemase
MDQKGEKGSISTSQTSGLKSDSAHAVWSMIEPGIAVITLNRPSKLNAFTSKMAYELVRKMIYLF